MQACDMSTRPGARAVFAVVLAASACLLATPVANAQLPSGVVLTLTSQTPYTTVKDPVLRMSISAQNPTDQTFTALSVSITVGQAIRSRTQYDASLTAGPGLSPLSVEGVTYVEDGRQNASNMPTAYEGSITVE